MIERVGGWGSGAAERLPHETSRRESGRARAGDALDEVKVQVGIRSRPPVERRPGPRAPSSHNPSHRFAACVVIALIHSYLGLHVLLRGVIFVDLALAQMAALGAVLALVDGHPHGTAASFAYSLGAALFGAAIFSFSRLRESRVPQEAIKELLAGSILWATWGTVGKLARLYAVVAVVHYLLRRRMIAISEDAEAAEAAGLRVRLWDFVFYALFGLVITLSVEVAGVLIVFAYLVAPAIIALDARDGWRGRLVVGCTLATLASAAGLAASYGWDLPSGPAIVCVLGLFLALFAAWRTVRGRMAAAG